jgi:FixJ family two-component response regulator
MKTPAPRVTVVEDDAGLNRAMSRILKVGGYEPLTFASAEEMLQSPEARIATCLVLDLQLPGMGGFALYDMLCELGPGIPVVFITAYEEADTRTRVCEGPRRAFLAKPFTGQALLETVGRLAAA